MDTHEVQTVPEGPKNFQVITNHSPLVPILNSHHLDEIDNHYLDIPHQNQHKRMQ